MENEKELARREIREAAAFLCSTQGIDALVKEYISVKELLAEASTWGDVNPDEIAELQEEHSRLEFEVRQAQKAEFEFYEEIEEFTEGHI